MLKENSGQALVIVLLIMSVVLTIALSVVSRSVTDISVSQKEEDALRAISAAESGIEQLLVSTGTVASGNLSTGATFNAQVTGLGQASKEYVLAGSISSGDSANVWFISHNGSGGLECSGSNPCFAGDRLKICWGNSGTSSNVSTTPAIEFSVLYTSGSGTASTAKIGRAVFDPNSSRRGENQFAVPDGGSCTIAGRDFAFGKELTLSSLGVNTRNSTTSLPGPVYGRMRMIYNTEKSQPAGITVSYPGNENLPAQGTQIVSTGSSGEAKRKVVVTRPYPDLAPVFDFGLFSGTTALTK